MKEAKPEAIVQTDTEEQGALHDNTTPLDGLRGLWNLGSTCYANAVWKMFANCDVFVSALVNFDTSRLAEAVLPAHSWQDNAKEFKKFAALLVQFYRDLVDLADPKPMRPTKLMDLARHLNPVFKADQQQDAAEFADFLFATLNVCLRIASGRNLPAGQISYHTLQRVQCECGYHNERLIPDKTMKIAIDPDIMSASESNVTLMQLIGNEFRNTPTPEDFICSRCHLSNHATISRLLTTVPSYLFVHLKRFQHDDGEGRKVKEHINFPIMALDILPVVHPSCRGQSSTTYDCISIVEHLGDNLEFGHYITKNRRYNSDDWVSHDDTKIREVPAGSIVTKDAYMLLYRQRTTPTGLQVLDERPAVFNPKPAMSKVQALKHKYEQAKRTADAGREKPTAIQARFELNEKKVKQAYEQALAEE